MRYGGLIAAIVFAAVAAVVVLKMSSNRGQSEQPVVASQAPQTVKTTVIYVAKTAIPVGTVITGDMIASQPWPEHLVLAGFMPATEGAKPVEGMVARGSFQQSEPIIASKLANPNDPSFLAGELPTGMRVVTIPLNEIDGVAGFVGPGDHVDLLFTHEVTVGSSEAAPSGGGAFGAAGLSGGAEKEKTMVTETLLTNVKVLAIDQRASSVGGTDKAGNLLVPKSASLMVTQADAQRIRLAQKSGTVSLALRALVDKESTDSLLLTDPSDISLWQGGSGALEGGVKVTRGVPRKQSETVAQPANMAPPAVPTQAPVTP